MKLFKKILAKVRAYFVAEAITFKPLSGTQGIIQISGDVTPEKLTELRDRWAAVAEKIGPYNLAATDLQDLNTPAIQGVESVKWVPINPIVPQDVAESVNAFLPSDVIQAMRPRVKANTVIEVIEDDATEEALAVIDWGDYVGSPASTFLDLLDGQHKTFDDFIESHRATRVCFYIGLEADTIEQGLQPLAQALMEMHERYTILAVLQPPAALQLIGGHYILFAYVFAAANVYPNGPSPVPDGVTGVVAQDPWIFQEGRRPSLYVGGHPIDYSKFEPTPAKILEAEWPKAFNALGKIAAAHPFPWPDTPKEPHPAVEGLNAKNDPEVKEALLEYYRSIR